ncbi:MAG: type IV toxin-antitoxin system AbiEi family antitoxin domain-containing protein [Actinomycetia bacterium]|nr:type IV toxin-antitoxin system AbiEi family antitoxin domain-containing protein [Actinomycetes bacterium]MCP3912022.1 type IV toxin-antitoxin system AbiEi family antitoxin domain-containing protein [Actinomycetes bacterium]MCP4088145.1 type IV toxin-antitoxin system AbiEi family antitoxin domain-containing protein [Actinomycetes bacterium]
MTDPIDDLFARQFGIIINPQAREAGMSQGQITRRVAQGRWERLRLGAYRSATTPLTWQGELLALVLLTGGTASHRSAVRLDQLDGSFACAPEVTVEHPRQRPWAGAIVHGSTQMDLIRPRQVNGIAVTPVERSLIDVANVIDPRRLTRMVDDALRRNLTTLDRLWGTLVHHGARGRNGTAAFRADLDHREAQEGVPLSAWSRWVATLLANSGLPEPVLEHRIDHRGSFVAQVDLAYPGAGVAIELDSISFHARLERFDLDPRRRNQIRNAGWHLIEVTWDLYTNHPQDLVATVCEALQLADRPSNWAT